MKIHSPEWQRFREDYRLRREKFVRNLTTEDKITLADAWVSTYNLEMNFESRENTDYKVGKCLSDPSVGFEMIELIWKRLSGEDDLSFLGVLVEDWLALHGSQVVAQLEQLTAKDRQFAGVLQFVYPNTMPKAVYLKVKELAGNRDA